MNLTIELRNIKGPPMFKKIYMLFFALLVSISSVSYLKASSLGEGDETFIREAKPKYKIPGYDTYLVCSFDQSVRPMTQINFDIVDESGQIGLILLQYYPDARNQFYQSSPAGTLRLRHIEINKKKRRQGHAGRALETLFTTLRKHGPKEISEVWLECNVNPDYLIPFYEKFGFTRGKTTFWGDVIEMSVALKKTKFPYFKALKEVK